MSEKEEKETDEKKDWPNCVFYPDIKCPVRKEMRGTVLDKYIKPFEKGTDEAQVVLKIADALKGMFQGEFMILHGFCQICPIKHQKDQVALREALAKALQPSLDKTMKAVEEAKQQLEQTPTLALPVETEQKEEKERQ